MTIIKQFEKPYAQMGKHRKKCRECKRLIQDGELVCFELIQTERWYPVKGLMTFNNWKVRHVDCH